MKLLLSFCCLIFCTQYVQGQNIECVNASKMSWSGGIAGRTGINYSFTFKIKGYIKATPDSLWIGGNVYCLFDSTTHSHAYLIKYDGHYTTISVNVAEAHDEYNYTPYKEQGQVHHTCPPPNPHKYPAMLMITFSGKEHYVAVRQIDELPSQSYP